MSDIIKKDESILPALIKEVEDKIVDVRGQKALLDRDVAALYGIETREVNQAVRNNPRKFIEGYVIELSKEESNILRSKFLTLERKEGKGHYSKFNFKAFTRKGLYMLATCLKSDKAADATIAIVETFDKVQTLKHELLESHSVDCRAVGIRRGVHDRAGRTRGRNARRTARCSRVWSASESDAGSLSHGWIGIILHR
jgi:phage regulator Rha-like protein